MSSIWIPYIIFRNTDKDDAVDIENTRAVVSIKRQGNFVRSGLDVADEVVQFTLKPLLYCKFNLLKDWDIQWRGKYDNIESNSQQEVSLHVPSALLSLWHSGKIKDSSKEYNEHQQQIYLEFGKYSGLPCSSAVRAIF